MKWDNYLCNFNCSLLLKWGAHQAAAGERLEDDDPSSPGWWVTGQQPSVQKGSVEVTLLHFSL